MLAYAGLCMANPNLSPSPRRDAHPDPDPNPDPNPNQVGASTPGRDANPPNPDPDPNPHHAQVLRQDGMQMAQVG